MMMATLPKKMSVLSCQTGMVMVFATFNLMVWAISVVQSFGAFLYYHVTGGHSDYIMLELLVRSQASFLLLVFAAFLFHGVLKKIAVCIKAYLVLGAVLLFLSGFSFLVFVPLSFYSYSPFPDFWYWSPGVLAMIIMAQVFYALILAIIYNTYRKIKAENDLNEDFNKNSNMPSPTRLQQFSVCSSMIGAMIFAVFNLIGSIVGVLVGFSGFVKCASTNDFDCGNRVSFLLYSEISFFVMVFAVFLFHGVLKKHQGHIKVYLVMGAVVLFLSNFAFMVIIPTMSTMYPFWPFSPLRYWDGRVLALTIAAQVVYALILAMINSAYRNIKAASKEQDEQKVFLIQNMNESLSTSVHKGILLYSP